MIVANLWRGFPFISLILLAGLQSIPAALYEAASVDGASAGGASGTSRCRASSGCSSSRPPWT